MAELTANIANKEMIAARMFRHGARYWGYKDTDIDNFDPLVRLLIEACAVELYRISNEINSAQEHMLEKLARLLTPEVHTAPKPAHAVVHARPAEAVTQVYPSMQFFFQKKVASKSNGPLDANIDVFFSPAGNYKVVDGDIKFIAAGSDVYAINTWQYKETFIKTGSGKKFDQNSIWLGIEMNHQVKDLTGLSFFFDLKNQAEKMQLLPLLHYSKWTINGKVVNTREGLWNPSTGESLVNSFTGFDEFNINHSVERLINNYYNNQFITIADGEQLSFKTEKYPAEFTNLLSNTELGKLQKELLWINLKFLPEFNESVLDALTVSINSFPVANRHLNELRYRLQNNFNIIPLLSTEQFLSAYTVEGSDGGSENKDDNKYSSHPFDSTSELKVKGTYTLRSSDIERFDSRNATEYMNYLIELLRDESSAFAALGQDFVASLVKELDQNITQLEQKIKQNISTLNQQPTYLLVNPRKEGETIFVSYWTTNGEMGNLIRSGSKLDLYQGADIIPESLIMLTNSTGGSDKLKNTEILNAYKNTLITRGRVVTLEDVKSFCSFTLGEKAKNISIKKGVAVSNLPTEGLINTVEIQVTPTTPGTDEEEWNGIAKDLLTRLEMQSAIMVNYRISIVANN